MTEEFDPVESLSSMNMSVLLRVKDSEGKLVTASNHVVCLRYEAEVTQEQLDALELTPAEYVQATVLPNIALQHQNADLPVVGATSLCNGTVAGEGSTLVVTIHKEEPVVVMTEALDAKEVPPVGLKLTPPESE